MDIFRRSKAFWAASLILGLGVSSTAVYAGQQSLLDPYSAAPLPTPKAKQLLPGAGAPIEPSTTYVNLPMDGGDEKAKPIKIKPHHSILGLVGAEPKTEKLKTEKLKTVKPKTEKMKVAKAPKPPKQPKLPATDKEAIESRISNELGAKPVPLAGTTDSGNPKGETATAPKANKDKKLIGSSKAAGSKIVDGSKVAGSKLVEGSKSIGEDVANGTKKVGSSIATGAKASGGFFMKGAKVIGDGFKGTGEKLKDSTNGLGSKINPLAKGSKDAAIAAKPTSVPQTTVKSDKADAKGKDKNDGKSYLMKESEKVKAPKPEKQAKVENKNLGGTYIANGKKIKNEKPAEKKLDSKAEGKGIVSKTLSVLPFFGKKEREPVNPSISHKVDGVNTTPMPTALKPIATPLTPANTIEMPDAPRATATTNAMQGLPQ